MISDEGIVQKIVDLDYQSYRRQQPAARDIVQLVVTMASEITEGFPIEFKGLVRTKGACSRNLER